jgi:hypothetical protein
MTDLRRLARRYLLGELTDAEQQAFEQAYFDDPQRFDEVAAEESALVDDYVRGRLAADERGRFESFYMSRPERRQRVAFAEALLARADGPSATTPRGARQSPGASWLSGWFGGRGLTLAAGVAIVVLGIALWTTWRSARPSDPGQQAQTNSSPTAPPVAVPAAPASVVTLALAVGAGERSSRPARPATLEIPSGTDIVRFALTLRERDYGRYRVLLRPVGGADIVQQGDLRPNLDPAGPAFTIDVPAPAFTSGDYMLTLQGALTTGEFDDLSQAIIRVQQVR